MSTSTESPTEGAGAGVPAAGKVSRGRRLVGRAYRLTRALLALGMLLQLLLAAAVVWTPLTEWLYDWLDVTGPAEPADYIVCLGGRDHRLIWAANLYQQGLAPQVIVSNAPGAAEQMRAMLNDFGVPIEDVLVDHGARTTADHPETIARLEGIDPATQRFLIVTDDEHSRRVAACFNHGGYQHFTVYAGKAASSAAPRDPARLWKERVLSVPMLAYEFAALAKYWYTGKI